MEGARGARKTVSMETGGRRLLTIYGTRTFGLSQAVIRIFRHDRRSSSLFILITT